MKKILFFYNKLMDTFWFIPVLIIILSIFLSVGLVILDQEVQLSQDGLGKYFFVNSADSARSILSTISGAMIGVAGTVFSVTLVALTLASSQFGPRLIKNFMYVRLNQVVLGSYVATYLYCLFVLNAIKENDSYTFMPIISILVAIIAALVNIILLIIFIHKIATSIQADKVISDVSENIHNQIHILYPKEIGEPLDHEKINIVDNIKAKYQNTIAIKSQKSGYLQYIDGEYLLKETSKSDTLLELHFRPGDHLVENVEIGKMYFNNSLEEKQIKKICNQFLVGKTKVGDQDVEFSIHQMVEIASRALSPGVNDPYTAITCIDNLTASLCLFTKIDFPSKYRVDEEKKLRLIANTTDFEGLMNASFNQIRQFSAGSTAVIIKLMEALITINEFATKKSHKKAVIKHAKMVLNVGKHSIKESFDYNDLEERSKKILSQ
ncbi:DUF2254 domain-containing protein [uncultured Flavobacterium sp.]|uniref:DUF2254 domain-containing protein n=1 Tax=uncultured Flavobacterium sp. TaxID=165435 RepID=UPI0030C86BDD